MDRMEVIRIAGYVHQEKMAIAKHCRISPIEETTGVGIENMEVSDEVMEKMIKEYAREARSTSAPFGAFLTLSIVNQKPCSLHPLEFGD
eukprot:534417-Amphidinium_carterae.2